MRYLALLITALVVTTALADERRISKEAVVKAAPDAVWKAWTTNEGVQSFFAPEAVVEARPDGPFFIHFNPYAKPGGKGADDMRVLAVQEGRMLSFTWNAPPQFPEIRGQRTYVTVRFFPEGDGQTKVTLVHGGWGDGGQWDQVYTYFDGAWGRVLANLQKRFVDGPIDWAPFVARLKAEAEKK